LKSSQSLLNGAESPAVLGGKRLNGIPFFIQRANVSEFYEFASPFFNPAKGQTLCAADVRPVRVDPATTLTIQKGAGTLRMRNTLMQQFRIMFPDSAGLDLKYCQFVGTALGAAEAALKSMLMRLSQGLGPSIHFSMDLLQG
jgi:hypothetical protein